MNFLSNRWIDGCCHGDTSGERKQWEWPAAQALSRGVEQGQGKREPKLRNAGKCQPHSDDIHAVLPNAAPLPRFLPPPDLVPAPRIDTQVMECYRAGWERAVYVIFSFPDISADIPLLMRQKAKFPLFWLVGDIQGRDWYIPIKTELQMKCLALITQKVRACAAILHVLPPRCIPGWQYEM